MKTACAMVFVGATLWAGACKKGSENPDSGIAAADTGLCSDPPVVTWENFGEGFMVERCQSCHASTTDSRYGAPESVTFDTHEEVLAHQDRILDRLVSEDPMPPQGGVDEDDLYLVQVWLTCWEEE